MKLKLTSNDILNKEFDKNVKGYDALEVDKFLDQVLEDYRVIDDVVGNLNLQIRNLKSENDELTKKMDLIESQKEKEKHQSFRTTSYSHLDNLELLKKISAYESKLYELGVDPSKIK
ncbi:MAG: DivIVA domain-containing protein [Bacilli bacterium]